MPTFDDRLRQLFDEAADEEALRCVSWMSELLAETPSADAALVGMERLLRAVPDRAALFRQLAAAPRAIEVLLKVFAASPFLTEILLREPNLLTQLTQPQQLRDLRSRPEFFDAAMSRVSSATGIEQQATALREFQHGELLRIGVCDFLGLFDLRSVTNQLSLLADAIVQAALRIIDKLTRSASEGMGEMVPNAPSLALRVSLKTETHAFEIGRAHV